MAGVSLDEGGSSNSYGNNNFHPLAFAPIIMPNSMQGVEFFPIHPYHIMGSAASTTPPGSPSSPSLGLSLSLSLLGSGGDLGSPCGLTESMAAFSKFLPSNNEGLEVDELAEEVDGGGDEIWPGGMDVFACDEFRMYEFKVRKCMRGRSHDWTECPFAHPGEKARRRDPRRFRYTGTACPEFRKGSCKRGDACEFAHGVFECWLHPDRYRTLSCKDGRSCKRRVCFFAHTPQQLRSSSSSSLASSASSSSANLATSLASTLARHSIPGSYDGSPLRHAIAAAATLDAIYNHPCSDSGIPSSPLPSPSSTNLSALSPTVVARNSIPGSYDGSPLRHAIATAATLDAIYNQSCNDAAAAASSSPSSTLMHSGPGPLSSSSLSPTLVRSSISGSYDGSPLRHAMAAAATFDSIYNHPCSDAAVSSPTSTLTSSQIHSPPLSPSSESPPLSPHLLPATPAHRRHLDRLHTIPVISIPSFEADPTVFTNEVNPVTSPPPDMSDLAAKLGHLQLRAQTWDGSRISSPSPRTSSKVSVPSPLSCCQRSSSVSASHLSWVGDMEKWNDGEEPVRVESGREIRAAIYGKLSRDNPLSSVEPSIDWVDDLIQ